jgi:hypothetical protein
MFSFKSKKSMWKKTWVLKEGQPSREVLVPAGVEACAIRQVRSTVVTLIPVFKCVKFSTV